MYVFFFIILLFQYIHLILFQIMLQNYNAKNAQFRILPQYKVKSEGEVVSWFINSGCGRVV